MNLNFEEILEELSYRIPEGIINLTKEEHVNILEGILIEYGVPNPNEISQKARVYFSYVNEEDIVKNKKSGNVYVVQNMNPSIHSKPTPAEISKAKAKNGGVLPKEKAEKNKGIKNVSPSKKSAAGSIGVSAAEKRKGQAAKNQQTIEPTTTTKRTKKNKELNQKINTKKLFNEGDFQRDGVSDKDFKSNKKVVPTPKQIKANDVAQFFVDQNGNTNFPKKYLKVLARLLNTKSGNGLTISDFTNASGAGTLSSTMGELMTLMAITIKDEAKANKFFELIANHVKENGKDSIIDVGWVKSAQKVRDTLFKRYNRKFGKGKWQLEQMAWDIEGEVEGLGLPNYKQNKGFSTDVYAKVKVNGKSVLDEISLKKEIKANLLNATSGRVQDIMVRGAATEADLEIYDDLNTKIEALVGLKNKASVDERRKLVAERDAIVQKYNAKVPNEAKVSYAQQKQRELHEDFITSGTKEVDDFLNKFCSSNKAYRNSTSISIKNNLNQKDDYAKQVTAKIDAICKQVKAGNSYGEALDNLEKSDYQKLNLSIMAAIAEENPKSKAAKSYKSIIENSHSHAKAVREFLLKDKNARKGLFASIKDAFPLKALFEGEENMILGDVSADRQVLQDVFGVNRFEDIEQKLTIRDEPPPPSIVYRVVGKQDIPVAEIASRPDGIGYGGVWKLDMVMHSEFAKRLKESNEKLNI